MLLVASIAGLAFATRTLPIGTSYAVWVGIGAAGTMLVGVLVHHEAATPARIGFVLLLVASVIGLRLTEASH